MADNVALIAGARGICGRALVEHLDDDPAWEVIGISRGPKDFSTGARFIALDLLDRAACEAALGHLTQVTHVFFTAVTRPPTAALKADEALAMLVNLLDVIEPVAANLAHVQLMQGTNWYGSHLGPFPTPAGEEDPRMMPPNFYYPQHDWLVERRKNKSWTWSGLRPHGVYGFSSANPVSHLNGLALYGAISKELGLPLRFPGRPGHFERIYQFTDARHLAKGMVWAATSPGAADEAFNFTNGDFQRWCNLWPMIADFFAIPAGPVQTIPLAAMMADKEPLWAEMGRKYGLREGRLADLVDWGFNERIWSTEFDQLSSMNKARKAGWTGVVDSAEMLLRLLGEMREMHLIP